MTPEAAAAALDWLAAMGADEIIGETPVDRLRLPAPAVAAASPAPAAGHAAVPAGAEACQSLDEIGLALAALDHCPLKKTATNLCYYDGDPRARVMLVGEAPGRDEDLQGKPFVGRSGQLLDRMLASIGLARRADDPENSVFITNVIFWRPPGNRTPTEAETTMCLPYLIRTIELQKPQVIVCLGATPAQRLSGRSEGILKMRGRWIEAIIRERRIPLLPTLHPAYLLRQPAQKRLAWRDLLSLRQFLDAH
jgi:DNA polymerase